METLNQYMQALKYLPDDLKDFHDQKDLFKAMHALYQERLENELPAFNWRDSMIYNIDFFLWFMGLHGYKLQKTRSKTMKFCDLKATVKQHTDKTAEELKKLLDQYQ